MLAPILLGSRGLTGEKGPHRLTSGDLVIAENVNYGAGNLVEKEGGSLRFNATALTAAVRAGIDWWPDPSTQRVVVATADGKLLKDDLSGAFATTLKTGLTVDRVTHFFEGGAEAAGRNRKLFAFNGIDRPQVLSGDGATTANLATPPADWSGSNQPSFALNLRNVMVAGGNANFLHQVYGSLAADHEDFTTSGTWVLAVYPGEGQKLVGGLTAFGAAFLFKYPLGIYFVNDAAATVSGWFVQPVSRQYGMAPTPHAVAQIDEAIVAFVSNTGSIVLMQESSGSRTGVTFTDLTKTLQLRDLIRQNFNLSRLDRVQMRWYDETKQLHVGYAATGSTTQDRRLVLDFNEERTRVSITTKDVQDALWLQADGDRIPRLMAGGADGFVWHLDQTDRVRQGAAYTFRIKTAPTDFSDVKAEYAGLKEAERLHLEFDAQGDFDVWIEVFVDGRSKGRVPFSMSGAATELPFDLPATFEGSSIRRRSHSVVGEGHYFSFDITEDSLNNPRLARAWLEFSMSGFGR